MTEKRKLLILMISDGVHDALPLIHTLEQYFRREEIYLWLVNNKVIGKTFITFFQENNYSHLRVAKYVISKIDRKKKTSIIVGKDIA